MPRQWSQMECTWLLENAERFGIPWCASQLGRTTADCALMLADLGGKAKTVSVPAQDEPRCSPGRRKPYSVPKSIPAGWLTLAEAARLAVCHKCTLHPAILDGRIEGRKVNGAWIVSLASVRRWMAGRDRAAQAVAAAYEASPQRKQEQKPEPEKSILDMVEPASVVTPEERAFIEQGVEPEKPEAPKKAPERTAKAKEQVKRPAVKKIIPAAPLPDERPAETSATRSERSPSPQAPRQESKPAKKPERKPLESMSKMDILRALASGELEGLA